MAAYAERRAQLERTFSSLPPAGSQAYWEALNAPTADGHGIPLEVLARCWRAWYGDYRSSESDQVFEIIIGRVEHHIDAWANRITFKTPAARASGLKEDLKQECYMQLLQDLASAKAFLFENFISTLTHIEQHVAHAVMEREGIWPRTGVRQPSRTPTSQIDSLNEMATPNTLETREARIADPAAEAHLRGVETLADLDAALSQLTPEQRALYYRAYQEDLPQTQIADELGITTRAVRYQLDAIKRTLRALLADPDDAPTGDSQGMRKDNRHD